MSWRRQTAINKISLFLDLNKEDPIVLNIEKGIFNNSITFCKKNNFDLKWSNYNFVKHYSTNCRRILANISYTPNSKNFIEKIKSKKINAYDLVKCTKEEMYPELWSDIHLNIMKKYITKEEEISDGIFTCNNCKSKKTVYYQLQTRSADEPMTTYVTCTNCNKKWKC